MTKLLQKEGLLTLIGGVLSATFYGGFVWLLNHTATQWFWYGVAVLGVFSTSLLMIAIALIQHRGLRWLACFLPATAVAAFGKFQPAAIAGAGLLVIATLVASVTVRDHLDDYVKVQPTRSFWVGSQLVVIATIAALAGLYFPILVDQLQNKEVQFSEQAVEPFLRPLTPVLENFIPGFQPEQSQIPAPVVAELTRQLKQPHQQPLTMSILVTNFLNQHLSRFVSESPIIVSVVILVPAFFTIWFLSPALLWPVVFSITLLLWFFRKMRVVRLESHPEPVAHLTL